MTGFILGWLGVTTVGSAENQDIRVFGEGVEAEHCYIQCDHAHFSLVPVGEAAITIDGNSVFESANLNQGQSKFMYLRVPYLLTAVILLPILYSMELNIANLDGFYHGAIDRVIEGDERVRELR